LAAFLLTHAQRTSSPALQLTTCWSFQVEFEKIFPIPGHFFDLKMAAELSLESVALKMRRVKLEALAKGLHTDYSFIVGHDKATAQVSYRNFSGFKALNESCFYLF